MQLKKIKVYGRLRKFLGSSYFEAAVSSPAEAIRFLMCNFPEVEEHMCQQFYKVKMNNMDVSLEFLSMKGQGDIQIIPIASGAIIKAVGGAIFSAGAAVATTVVSTATAVAGAAISAASAVGGALIAEYGTTGILGAITTATANSLALTGVSNLLAPTPVPFENSGAASFGASDPSGSLDPQSANSYSFSGIQNVSISGVCVPIIYGEVFTGSVVISSGIDTVQVQGTI